MSKRKREVDGGEENLKLALEDAIKRFEAAKKEVIQNVEKERAMLAPSLQQPRLFKLPPLKEEQRIADTSLGGPRAYPVGACGD